MMTSPSELSLDSKPSNFAILSRSSGDRDQTMEQAQKLEEFLARLEEERLKIDAFKRELPLCMQLLNNAMEASREQLQSQRSNGQGPSSRPVLEEFIPLKKPNNSSEADQIENTENSSADKANWMTHAQLWNQESQETKPSQTPLPSVAPQETEIKLGLNGKQRTINGGAFHPFSTKDRVSLSAFPELALAPSHKEEMEEAKINVSENSERRENSAGNNNTVVEKEQAVGNNTNSTQPHRKARRCWSPDLHRRFVNALHMLGGSQVATPKQIRELMKVDGLTNDEVKSHLQKYRLHTRRPSPSPQATVAATPQVVVLGGIWVQPEYAAAAAHGAPPPPAAFYSPHAHHISPPLISPPPENNICPVIGRPPPPPPSQIPNAHHQLLHMYNNSATNINRAASFITHGGSSDDVRSSDVQGGNISSCDDDRREPNSESIGDEKSESGSWKAESDHHHHPHPHQNGSRRVVADNEESNASVVNFNVC